MIKGIGNFIAHLKKNAPNEWVKAWVDELSERWLTENQDIRGIRRFEKMTINDDDGTFRLYVNGVLFAQLVDFKMSMESSPNGTQTKITFTRSSELS